MAQTATRIGAAILLLGAFIGFLAVADLSPSALSRKEHTPQRHRDDEPDEKAQLVSSSHKLGYEAEENEDDFMLQTKRGKIDKDKRNVDCIGNAVHRLLEARAECESTYTTCVFACTARTTGADNAACVLACVQSTANCSAIAEYEMEQAWLGCRGAVQAAVQPADTKESLCIEDAVSATLQKKRVCDVNFTKCESDASAMADDALSHADGVMDCVKVSVKCTTEAEGELKRHVRACHNMHGQERHQTVAVVKEDPPPVPDIDPPPVPDVNVSKLILGASVGELAVESSVHRNDFCVGNMDEKGLNKERDGHGYICKKALLKPNCTTHEQLASLYCACCHCYRQCNMRETEWIGCRESFDCDA